MNLKSFGVEELSEKKSKNINGGLFPVIIGRITLSVSLDYSDGRRDKNSECTC
ncbi:hypothetical protein ACQY1Q_05800 [Tenacibaculum sp. TC6]|uniref:hypothetical protein n=1 Tax=Tenacibaculum sp. TC6 TaxID=3423223 RepID=UPI003D368FD4